MNDDSPKIVNNALRQAVIACVKSELQQPYNLGVINRDQFVRVCSTVTKEFLKDAVPGQTALTPSHEAHLRARTTALLTKQIGGGDSPSAPAPRFDVAEEPRADPVEAPVELGYHAHPAGQQPSPSAKPGHIGVGSGTHNREAREFYRGAAETPGAVLAATDSEVMKYQEHLARLSSLTGRGTPPPSSGSVGRYRAGAAADAAPGPTGQHVGEVVPMPQGGDLMVHHSQHHEQLQLQQQHQPPRAVGGHGAGAGASARHLHSDILGHIRKIESLHALIKNHISACESSM